MTTSPTARRFSLRARLLALAVALALAIVGTSALLSAVLGIEGPLGPTAAAIFLAVMALAASRVLRFHPFDRLGPANYVTTFRTALVALVAALLAARMRSSVAWAAVIVASAAASLDGLDGFLARRSNMSSAFGARFDMEVDALLILILGVFAWRYDKAGAWILLSGALRYGFVVAGWTLAWMRRSLPPNTRRKAVCVIQIVGLIVAISPIIERPLSAMAGGATLALLVWSFAVDVLWLWRARTPSIA